MALRVSLRIYVAQQTSTAQRFSVPYFQFCSLHRGGGEGGATTLAINSVTELQPSP